MDQEYNPRRLSQARHLRREAEEISRRIREMERAERVGNACIAGMPGAGAREYLPGAGKKIACMRVLLERKRMECLEELAAIYRFIDGIHDSVLRQIIALRYVDGKTWYEVARGIGEHDEQYPRRIHDAYFLNRHRYGRRQKLMTKKEGS